MAMPLPTAHTTDTDSLTHTRMLTHRQDTYSFPDGDGNTLYNRHKLGFLLLAWTRFCTVQTDALPSLHVSALISGSLRGAEGI